MCGSVTATLVPPPQKKAIGENYSNPVDLPKDLENRIYFLIDISDRLYCSAFFKGLFLSSPTAAAMTGASSQNTTGAAFLSSNSSVSGKLLV